MKLTPPTKVAWWISVVLGVLGLLGTLVSIPVISGLAFWLVLVGLVVLVLATLLSNF